MQEIETLFKENCESYTIETDNYQYESIDEITKSGVKHVESLKINGTNPSVSLDFDIWGSDVSSFESKGKANSFAFLLRDRMRSKESRLIFVATSYIYQIIVYSAVYFSAIIFIKDKYIKNIVSLLIMVLFFVYLFLFQLYLKIPKNAIIYFFNREERGGFFKRNADKLLLIIISAVLGSIVTLIVNYILKYFNINIRNLTTG